MTISFPPLSSVGVSLPYTGLEEEEEVSGSARARVRGFKGLSRHIILLLYGEEVAAF